MLDPILNWTICLSLALLWSAAAWDKIHAGGRFRETLAAYRLLPRQWTPAIARLLPLMESIIAAGLVIPAGRHLAALLSAGLLSLYGLAMAINLMRGLGNINCGCQPGHDQPLSWLLVIRNIVFCALSLALLLPLSGRPTGFWDILLALILTVLVCTIYLFIGSIIQDRDSSNELMD